jgi:glycerate 2-kinase
MRVVIAPDKFKGSLTAVQVTEHVGVGLRAAAPGLDLVAAPVADGGDGTLDAVTSAGFDRVPTTATGPTGDQVSTAYARRGEVAVIELATVCGLLRLPGGRFDALGASSFGFGEVIAAALDAGANRIVLGLGGSASTDGGMGLLQALGADIRDAQGAPVGRGGVALPDAATVDLTGLHPRLREAELTIASDVDNPLVGPNGAAAVYGPQKGASSADVTALDEGLRHWASVVTLATGIDRSAEPGAGAAGGVGFATIMLGGEVRSGIDLLLDVVDFDGLLRGADLVITGEGSLDLQTLSGKAPVGVAAAAARQGIPVVAVAGRVQLSAAQLADAGIRAAYALTDVEPDVEQAIAHAGPLLEQVAAKLARDEALT